LGVYASGVGFKTGEEPFNFLGLVMLNGKAGARIGYRSIPICRNLRQA